MSGTCRICGGLVLTALGASLHPGKLAQIAERDMQAHLDTHSFAEVLRFEIRQDLEDVPDEQRPAIVRDIYRSLLGTVTHTHFTLYDEDRVGVYSLDEALGDVRMYQLWRNANSCGLSSCRHA